MTALLPNSVSGEYMRQTGKGLFLPVVVLIWMYSQDPHILGILELHPGRETGLLLVFERLKISDVDVWT